MTAFDSSTSGNKDVSIIRDRRPTGISPTEPFTRKDKHTVTLKSGQYLRIDSAITGNWSKGLTQTANHLACARKLSQEFSTYFASLDPAHIQFNQSLDDKRTADQSASRTGKLCYDLDRELIKDRLQAAFKCSQIDTVQLVCPHEKQSIDIDVLTDSDVRFEATVELAYQPRDGLADIDQVTVDKVIRDSIVKWKELMKHGSYSDVPRCPIETPFKLCEPMIESHLFMLDRVLIKTAECDIRSRFAIDLEHKIKSKQPNRWVVLGLGGLYGLAASRYASHRALKTVIKDINRDLQALETAYASYKTDKWIFIVVCIVFAVLALNVASMELKGAGIWDSDRHKKLNIKLIILAATIICGLPIGFVTMCFCTAVPGAYDPMA